MGQAKGRDYQDFQYVVASDVDDKDEVDVKMIYRGTLINYYLVVQKL